MQIQLYHFPTSRSQRIIWLFEELEIDYELMICNKNNPQPQTIPQSALPLKFPTVLIQTDHEKIVLTESSAITEFFADYFSKLVISSSNLTTRQNYIFWKNYADASFMPNLALKQIFAQINQQTPFVFRWVSYAFKYAFNAGFLNQVINDQLNRINTHLEQNDWLAGDAFTIADILLWFPLQACVNAHKEIHQFPSILRYIDQIQQRPAFQKSLNKGLWDDSIFQQYWKQAW